MPQALSIAIGLLMLLGGLALILWLIVRSVKRSEDPARMAFKWVITFFLVAVFAVFLFSRSAAVPVVAAVVGISLSLVWTPSIGAWMAKPLTSLFDGGDQEPDPQPLYSIATARRKRGQYQEAIRAVQEQLARFPTDFPGQMMIAEMQAENLQDLNSARVSIQRICLQPVHPAPSIAYALNSLSEWEMKFAQDPEAARVALEDIIRRYPDSEQAHVAAQRISHLSEAAQQLAPHERRTITLNPGAQDIGLMRETASLRKPEENPAVTASAYVKHLEKFPVDNEVREKLAVLYMEHYQRMDLAAMQLEELIRQPHAPAVQIVRWLNLLADWQIRYTNDKAGAQATLERIISLYPNLFHAQLASQRITHLELEMKGKEMGHSVKLGSYETDLGLKPKASVNPDLP